MVAVHSVRCTTFQLTNVAVTFTVGDWRVDFLVLLEDFHYLTFNCIGQSFVNPVSVIVDVKPGVGNFVGD